MLTTEISKPDLKVLDINLVGVSYSVKLFMAHIHQVADDGAEVRGRIVVTASEGGLYALPTDPVYCASKHAVCFSERERALFHYPQKVETLLTSHYSLWAWSDL